jgi:hypothetical protein
MVDGSVSQKSCGASPMISRGKSAMNEL